MHHGPQAQPSSAFLLSLGVGGNDGLAGSPGCPRGRELRSLPAPVFLDVSYLDIVRKDSLCSSVRSRQFDLDLNSGSSGTFLLRFRALVVP